MNKQTVTLAVAGAIIGAVVVETTIPVAASSVISSADTFETAAPSVSGLDLVVPFARAAAVADTKVSVFNPGTQSADVTLILGKADGTQITGSRLTLGPKQSAHTSLNELGRSDLDSVTHVFVHSSSSILRSDRPVFAVATVRNFNNGSGIVGQDAGIVQALPSDKLSSSVSFPFFFQVMGYFTLLIPTESRSLGARIRLLSLYSRKVAFPETRRKFLV